MIAFGFALHALFHDENSRFADHSHHWQFRSLAASPASAVYFAFQTMVGEFNFNLFDVGPDTGLPSRYVRKAVYAACVVAGNLILLNVLIAIMTSAFGRINNDVVKRGLFERARLIHYFCRVQTYAPYQCYAPFNIFSLAYTALRHTCVKEPYKRLSAETPAIPTMHAPGLPRRQFNNGTDFAHCEEVLGRVRALENISYNRSQLKSVVFAEEIARVREREYGGTQRSVPTSVIVEEFMSCTDPLQLIQ